MVSICRLLSEQVSLVSLATGMVLGDAGSTSLVGVTGIRGFDDDDDDDGLPSGSGARPSDFI